MPIRRSPNGARHSPSTGSRDPGMGGRDPSERVVAISWNEWSRSIGIAGRDHPVRAADTSAVRIKAMELPTWKRSNPSDTTGTTPLSVYQARVSRGHPPRGRGSFECLHGLSILLVGPGPGADMREAQALQAAIDRIVRDRDAELLVEPHDQIAGPPAHDAIDRRDRAVFHEASEECFICSFVSLPGAPGDALLMKPSGPCSLNRIT
jgi:hypothetical protein